MNGFKVFCFMVLLGWQFTASAERIKDVSMVEGVRSNQLVGYGLVVGLPGTGEQSRFTEQSFKGMLNSFGITLPASLKPKIKNVAAVAVHAELPPFRKPGQTIDITVSSIGSAGSLRGGTLLQTFLKGVDGNVYAIAQGSLIVGGLGAEGLDGSRV
ncbi:MAG: flagellar basal body P-ring protein FlgI, partial [Pseudoalteromonas tetraodonis]